MKTSYIISLFVLAVTLSCSTSNKDSMEEEKASYQLMTLDPGHFHAALVQKMQLDDVDPTVYVYAPDGPDVQNHLNTIKGYNTREEEERKQKENANTNEIREAKNA